MDVPLGAVSVVVPVFDGERYLAEALSSVLAQGPAVRDVVVVDDGSRDRSAEVARSFGGIVRVIGQGNRGPAAARNRGLAEVTEPLVAFLDADDVWEPASLEPRIRLLEAEPDLDLVLGTVEEFLSPEADDATRGRLRCRPGRNPALLCGGVLCRRTVFERVGTFDERLQSGEFVDWYARVREAGVRCRVLPLPCLRRRLHGGNLTLRHQGMRRDFLGVAAAALERRRARRGAEDGPGS